MAKVLLVILTLPLRLVGIVLAGVLKVLGKFIAVVSVVLGLVTTIIGALVILASGGAIVMHFFGHFDFSGFWLTAGLGLFTGFLFVMVGQLGETIGEWIDDLGTALFEVSISKNT